MTDIDGAVPVRECTNCGWRTDSEKSHSEYDTLCRNDVFRYVKFEEKIHMIKNLDNTVEFEVRTTSSTGGQKGVKLERHSLIPVRPLRLLAEHYGKGAKKYADHQWRQGVEWDKLYDAAQRHLVTFWEGEDYDTCPPDRKGCASFPDDPVPIEQQDNTGTCYNHTGSLHLVSAAWMIFALIEEYETHQLHDNRYISESEK